MGGAGSSWGPREAGPPPASQRGPASLPPSGPRSPLLSLPHSDLPAPCPGDPCRDLSHRQSRPVSPSHRHSLLPCKVMYSRGLGTRLGTSAGPRSVHTHACLQPPVARLGKALLFSLNESLNCVETILPRMCLLCCNETCQDFPPADCYYCIEKPQSYLHGHISSTFPEVVYECL